MPFRWEKAYSVGLEEIDDQHKMMFSIINKLFNSTCPQQVTEVIDELKEYLDVHFATEEKYMSEFNYPELEIHHRIHQEFREQIDQLGIDKTIDFNEASMDLLQVLYDWIVRHILNDDKKYAPYICQKNTILI